MFINNSETNNTPSLLHMGAMPVLQMLVQALQPSKIFCIPAMDDSIQLIIILSVQNNTAFTEIEAIVQLIHFGHPNITCSIHLETQVLEGLQHGHIFYSTHCIQANLLYSLAPIPYPITSPEALATLKKAAQEKLISSLHKADHFYEMASAKYKRTIRTPLIMFLLHQSVELIYRGLLQALNGYDKKTHEIRVLQKHARRCIPQLNQVFNEYNEKDKHLVQLLDDAYIKARYQDNYRLPETEMEPLLQKGASLLDLASKLQQTQLP